MDLPHICNMRMLIESSPCALLGLRFGRIFSMSCSVNVTLDKNLLVAEILLFFLTKGRSFAKKELNN